MNKKIIVLVVALSVVGFTAVGLVHASGTWYLSVTKTGSGHGYVGSSPAGIDCGNTCLAGFSPTTTVVYLGEMPASSSYFVSWSGCSQVTGTICVVDAPSASSTGTSTVNITATFNLSSSSHR